MELNRRLASQGVTSNAVHPGNMIYTSLTRNSWLYWMLYMMCRPFSKSAVRSRSVGKYFIPPYPWDSSLSLWFLSHHALCNENEGIAHSGHAHPPLIIYRLYNMSKALLKSLQHVFAASLLVNIRPTTTFTSETNITLLVQHLHHNATTLSNSRGMVVKWSQHLNTTKLHDIAMV